MFGFLKKKKPANALESAIFAIYGNPPPPKTAKLDDAIEIAHQELLMGMIEKENVANKAKELNSGPMPYSTHDLALSVAQSFFQSPEYVPHLGEAQLFARMKAMEWMEQKKVIPLFVQNFENVLYKLYKPGL